MPSISIVLPTYNGERFIRKAIDSIIVQTFTDWELIVVNDCSKDSTKAIVEEYSNTDSRIKVINNKLNQRLPRSLNIGFKYATGDYLTWTSDDNIYLPNALYIMREKLIHNSQINMVCADMETIDEYNIKIGDEPHYDDSKLVIHNSVGACFLYRKCVLEEIGKYDENMFLVEDYDYWIRIQEKYDVIDRIDTVLYQYRRHHSSLSETRKRQVDQGRRCLREKHSNYIVKKLIQYPDSLYTIFAENVLSGWIDEIINKMIAEYLPELKPIFLTDEYESIMIFGAGHEGRMLKNSTKCKVECFIDNNPELIGERIDDVIINSLDSVRNRNMKIVIAMSIEKQFEVVRQLWSEGYRNYTIWCEAN